MTITNNSFQKITFKNYKSFEQEQVFEIKPITLVIGRNNSGKSALVQLPLMLHTWLEDRNGRLSNGVNGIKFSKQMKELVFNSDKNRDLEISFTGFYGFEIIIKIQFIENTHTFSYLAWKYKNGDTMWKVEKGDEKYIITTIEPNSEPKIEYADSIDKFVSGISPRKDIVIDEWEEKSTSHTYVEETNEYEIGHEGVHTKTITLYEMIHRNYEYLYFTGLRHVFTSANIDFDEQNYTDLDVKGEFAAQYLYKNDDLLEKVKNWYIENMDGWGIGLDKYPTGFYLYLQDYTKTNGTKIPITQTGQGIAQALPLVTIALDDSRKYAGTTIIEQPELHIHPAAHGNLVELFAENAIKNHNNYILETHSEVMLLRVRRLVAEGKLKPEQVAIYWVDTEEGSEGKRSFLKKIEVDEFGMLDNWPEGVFADDHEEVLAIRRAQRRKEEVK